MPELCRFYGLVIRLYFADHNPPHFHAFYSGQEAVFSIEELSIIAGALPARARGLVVEWATLHQAELKTAWRRAQNSEPPGTIPPLP